MNITLFILYILALNAYLFFATRKHFKKGWKRIIWYSLLSLTLVWEIVTLFVVASAFEYSYSQSTLTVNIFMGVWFSSLISKIILIAVLFLNDVFRAGKWGVQKAQRKPSVSMESRRKFLTNLGIIVAAVPFTGLIYGVIKGKYDFKVFREKLAFKDLPQSFNGFKIAQISDVHLGSFDSQEAIRKGLRLLMEQKPDIILFTGDLVNNLAEEVTPHAHIFREELNAPFGKYAVMGNHDYGEYVDWTSDADRIENVAGIKQAYSDIGFTLLNNESQSIEINGQQIQLVGVENWGKGHFTKEGDYDKASQTIDAEDFKILLSHDPDHWDEKIIDHDHHVHLTLAGHTHGGQMGVELPWLKWTPVKYRYPRWAGLYKEKDQYLYVNRGFGFIGYTGRAGIWPEITLIELQTV